MKATIKELEERVPVKATDENNMTWERWYDRRYGTSSRWKSPGSLMVALVLPPY